MVSTNKLLEISQVVGIKVIDHVIIAENEHYSMREECDIIFSDSEKKKGIDIEI